MRSDDELLVSYSTFCLTFWACRLCYMLARCSASLLRPSYLGRIPIGLMPSNPRDHPCRSPTPLTK